MDKRSIEIDIDVHKTIELARENFGETDNQVLRRLLMIDTGAHTRPLTAAIGRSWIGKGSSTGLELPHGSPLLLQYNTVNMEGEVLDGAIVFEGESFTSPSAAAKKLCRTKRGTRTNLNGKTVIKTKLPGKKDWLSLSHLQNLMIKKSKAETTSD